MDRATREDATTTRHAGTEYAFIHPPRGSLMVVRVRIELYDCVVSEFRSTSSNRPPLTVTPLEEGQGCIAEPKANWVGIYWISATLLYTASVRHQNPLHCIPYLPNKLNHSC